MAKASKLRLAVVAFFLLTYLAVLGVRPMVIPDEFRYAEIPRELLESGDWNNPTLLGVPYYEKPAFGYQLTALSFKIFGCNRFALRLPAALGVALGAWVIWTLARRRRPENEESAAAAAVLYMTCGLVYGVGGFAVLDSQLTGFITLGIGAFYLGWTAERRGAQAAWLLASGAGVGLAFLVKGFLGIAIPGMVLGAWLLWQADWKGIRASRPMRLGLGLLALAGIAAGVAGLAKYGKPGIFIVPAALLPAALAVLGHGRWRLLLAGMALPALALIALAAPLAWAQHRAQPEFWSYFFWVEHVDRFFEGTSDSRPEPWWYFLPVFAGGIFPAALWLPAALRGWSGRWKGEFLREPWWRLALLWLALPFLFFTLASAKLGTYILPCFAPFALWLGCGVAAWRPCAVQGWVNRVLGMVLIVGGIGFPVYQILADHGVWFALFAPDEKWWIALAAIAMVWGVMLVGSSRNTPRRQFAVWFAGAALLLLFGQHAMPHALLNSKMPERGLEYFLDAGWVGPDSRIVVVRGTMHSAPWVWRRADVAVWGNDGELRLDELGGRFKERHYPAKGAGIAAMRAAIPRGKGLLVLRGEADERDEIPSELEPIEVGYHGGVWVAKF